MLSKITSKFQTTIPREIRDRLKLSVADVIEWRFDGSRIYVEPVEKPFLKYAGVIEPRSGDTKQEILAARNKRAMDILSK